MKIHASTVLGEKTMKIRKLVDTHNCHRSYQSMEAKAKWIAEKFERLIKSNPNVKVSVLKELLHERYKVNVKEHRLYGAKNRALQVLQEEHGHCFKIMRTYGNMILLTNPGSRAVIRTIEPNMTFQRMFVCDNAQRVGFRQGCNPFIGIDGTWLKSSFKGCLMTAVALDTNSGLFPVAVALCEGENDESWHWFLDNLKEFMDLPPKKPICLMSDRGTSILIMVPQVWLEASNKYSINLVTYFLVIYSCL